jgi:uncharacterized BrkB/YihY/UPF0761 family membrane protein
MVEAPAPRTRDGAALLLLRLGLVVLALVLLWAAFDRMNDYREAFSIAFRFSVGPVLLIALVAAAAGLSFGLAITVPTRFGGYRWSRTAVVGVLPLVLVVVYVLMFSGAYAWLPNTVVLQLALPERAGLIVSAILLGLAAATGFAEPKRPP